jgi:hypothetical protein
MPPIRRPKRDIRQHPYEQYPPSLTRGLLNFFQVTIPKRKNLLIRYPTPRHHPMAVLVERRTNGRLIVTAHRAAIIELVEVPTKRRIRRAPAKTVPG